MGVLGVLSIASNVKPIQLGSQRVTNELAILLVDLRPPVSTAVRTVSYWERSRSEESRIQKVNYSQRKFLWALPFF